MASSARLRLLWPALRQFFRIWLEPFTFGFCFLQRKPSGIPFGIPDTFPDEVSFSTSGIPLSGSAEGNQHFRVLALCVVQLGGWNRSFVCLLPDDSIIKRTSGILRWLLNFNFQTIKFKLRLLTNANPKIGMKRFWLQLRNFLRFRFSGTVFYLSPVTSNVQQKTYKSQ